jgi:cytochrome oxidase assembly protein ShyY1
MTKPNFWEVARRPKWLGGLALAMLVAIIFSLLMQWQLSRTFNTVGVSLEQSDPVPLDTLVQPNTSVTSPIYDRLVSFEAELDPENAHIVGGRLQLIDDETASGYWLITNTWVNGASLTLAIGYSSSLEEVEQAKQLLTAEGVDVVGYLEPGEPVKERVGSALGSVSLAQLVNLYSDQPIASYPAYVIMESGVSTDLEQISIGIRQQQIEVNWLTAFYAIEWAFFALAAFYLWWRMVKDQVIRERETA